MSDHTDAVPSPAEIGLGRARRGGMPWRRHAERYVTLAAEVLGERGLPTHYPELEQAVSGKLDGKAMAAYQVIQRMHLIDECLQHADVSGALSNMGELIEAGMDLWLLQMPGVKNQVLSDEALRALLDRTRAARRAAAKKRRGGTRETKARAQDLAREQWQRAPNDTITDVAHLVDIQLEQELALPPPESTVRRWITDVAPRGIRKRGRPRGSYTRKNL